MADSPAPVVVVAGQPYPPTLSTDEAAAWLGCDRRYLQAQRGTGRLPVEPLALGNRLRWPTLAVARAVGLPAEIDVAARLLPERRSSAGEDAGDAGDQGGRVVALSGRQPEAASGGPR